MIQKKEQVRYHNHPALFMNEFGKENGIPGFLLQSFAKQRTHAHSDATLLNQEQPYPVLFFSHSFGSNRGQSQFQVAELASHGYIVIAIDHTYYSPGTVFADGQTQELRQSSLMKMRASWTTTPTNGAQMPEAL